MMYRHFNNWWYPMFLIGTLVAAFTLGIGAHAEPNPKIHVKQIPQGQQSMVRFARHNKDGSFVLLLEGDQNNICTDLPGTQEAFFVRGSDVEIEGCWRADGDTLIIDTADGAHYERPKGFFDEVL